jgi:hypothetical protein
MNSILRKLVDLAEVKKFGIAYMLVEQIKIHLAIILANCIEVEIIHFASQLDMKIS